MRAVPGEDTLRKSVSRDVSSKLSSRIAAAAVSPYRQLLSKKSRREKGRSKGKGTDKAKKSSKSTARLNVGRGGGDRNPTSAFEEKAGFEKGEEVDGAENRNREGELQKGAGETDQAEQAEEVVDSTDDGEQGGDDLKWDEETEGAEGLSLAVATVAVDVVDCALRAASPGVFARPETEAEAKGEGVVTREGKSEEPTKSSKAKDDPFGFLKPRSKGKKMKKTKRKKRTKAEDNDDQNIVEESSTSMQIKESVSTPQLPQISQPSSPARRQPGVRLVYKKKKKRPNDPTTKRLRRLAASLNRLDKAKNGGSLAELDQLDIAGDGTLLRRTSPSKSASTPTLGSKKGVSEALLLRYCDLSINQTLDKFLRTKGRGEEGEEEEEGGEEVV